MSKNQILIPKRRFKGFSGEWKTRLLGEFLNVTTGKLDANAMVMNGKYDFYTSGIEKFKINTYAFSGPAITVAGNGATVGYLHLVDGKFNAYQRTYVLTNFLLDRYFVFYLLTKKLPKKITFEVRSGNIPYIVKNMLTYMMIQTPKQIPEQTKIGKFFENLDEKISFQKQKIDKLKDLKKAYLNKMFPKENTLYPELRFKGFNDEWEEKKLKENYDFYKGKKISLKSFSSNSLNKAIAYGHLYTIYDEVITKVEKRSNEEGFLSLKGDILFPGSSTVPLGTAQANALMLDNIHLGGDVLIARDRNERNFSPFMSYLINYQKYKMFPITTGTTIAHMYGKDLEILIYIVPSLLEQQKIGDFFQKLDKQISLYDQKINKLKDLKKAYLNEMFVNK